MQPIRTVLAFSLLCASVVAGAPPVEKTQVKVHLEPAGAEQQLGRPQLALDQESGPLALNVTEGAPGVINLELEGEGPWRLLCTGHQVCCPDLVIDKESTGPEKIFPLAVSSCHPVELRFHTETKDEMPREIRVEGSSGEDRIQRLLVLNEDGARILRIPSGSWDLRMSAENWAPVYRWGIHPSGKDRLSESIALIHGSSVMGFVSDSETGKAVPDVAVRLSGGDQQVAMPVEERRRRSSRSWLAKTDARGFFQIHHVLPGIYHVLVQREDMPEVQEGPFVVPADSELRLEDLRVALPSMVDVMLTPPVTPDGEAWTVRMSPFSIGETSPEVRETQVDPGGWAHFPGVDQGRWLLSVLDPAGREARSSFVEIDGYDSIDFPLDIVEIRGKIKWKAKALKARLNFSSEGIRAAGNAPFETETDASGAFSCWIPKPKHLLDIHIESVEPELHFELFEPVPKKVPDILRYDLDLAGSEITGVVLDQEEQGAPGIQVIAQKQDRPIIRSSTTSGRDGKFTMELPFDSAVELKAWSRDRGRSKLLRFEQVPEDITLKLLSDHEIKGRLVGAVGGISSAQVAISQGSPGWSNATTDLDGHFSLKVDGTAQRRFVTVQAPGLMLWAGEIDLPSDGDDLLIRLPAGGTGTLVLKRPLTLMRVLTGDGGLLDLSSLLNWAMSMGFSAENFGQTDMVIPGVAVGSYARIEGGFFRKDDTPADLAELSQSQSVGWAFLAAGGRVELDPPDEP